jgi:FdrA protein
MPPLWPDPSLLCDCYGQFGTVDGDRYEKEGLPLLKTIIKKDTYQDSVSLMLLSTKLQKMAGVQRATVMMATEANMAMFAAAGLLTDEVKAASPTDMAIVVEAEDEATLQGALKATEDFLSGKAAAQAAGGEAFATVRTQQAGIKSLPCANLTLISTPGAFAAAEARKALDNGLHVFMFSDNVSLEEEVALKQKAVEKGLLMMGPDCGTAIIRNVPLGFANVIRKGRIGIVGASGTGIQEVTCLIDRMGEGITHALGTGGRDLSHEVQARTARLGLAALMDDPATEVVVMISKPPAKEVEELILADLRKTQKPVVVMFLGSSRVGAEGNIYFTNSLQACAEAAVALARGQQPVGTITAAPAPAVQLATGQKWIKGLFAGGTLAGEAAQILDMLLPGEGGKAHDDGVMFQREGHQIIDFGDDVYTRGRAHPMIDPRIRNEKLLEAGRDAETAVILFDLVIGYGAHEDPAGSLAEILGTLKAEGRQVALVASVCGTEGDPQGYTAQRRVLEQAGVHVASSNAEAATWAAKIVKGEA